MKKINKNIKSSILAAFGLLLLASAMFGQTFKATVVGQITDSNGAVVPNATVYDYSGRDQPKSNRYHG